MPKISTSTIFIGVTLVGVLLLGLLIATGNNSIDKKIIDAGLPLKIEEYFDYACPHCQNLEPTMAELNTRFGADVDVQYIYFNIFPQSLEAAYAAEAAREQGKYLEYHRAIFSEYKKMLEADPRANFADLDLVKMATDLKLDIEKFNSYRASDEAKTKADAGKQSGGVRGVTSTPALFINGVTVKLETTGDGRDFSPLLNKVQILLDKVKQK